MQQGFLLRPVFRSSAGHIFKCTCFRSRKVEKLCGAFFQILYTVQGWTVGKFKLDHTHELKKESVEQIRLRCGWNNVQGQSSADDWESDEEGTSSSHSSESDSESEDDTGNESETLAGPVTGGSATQHPSKPSSRSPGRSLTLGIGLVPGLKTATAKSLQEEEKQVTATALKLKTLKLLKAVSLTFTSAEPRIDNSILR